MKKHTEVLFRGISNKFAEFPLTVSAMRDNEIAYLENLYKKTFGEESYSGFKRKIYSLPKSPITFFSSVNNDCMWAFFLSLTNILLVSKKSPNIIDNIRYPQICTTIFENAVNQNEQHFPEFSFNCTSTVFAHSNDFTSCCLSYSTVGNLVYAYEYFQHINFDYRDKNMNYNPFPTMVMDWTESLDVATQFATNQKDDGIILSINYSKYKKMIYSDWFQIFACDDIVGFMPGFTPYFDCNFYISAKNYHMQMQKGATLFWPWKYKIQELLTNKLGKKIDFTVVKK